MTNPQEDNFIPLYYKITADVIGRIRSGSLSLGDRVPSENEIRAAYYVSSTTARKALAELENQGWIRREKGRGSFVGRPLIDRDITHIISFTRNMEQMGLQPETRVLLKQVHTGEPVSLRIGDQDFTLRAPYLHIERLRLGSGMPIMLENRFIDINLCPNIEEQDLSQSLFALYENVYGCMLLNSHHSISAVSMDAEAARQLKCPAGSPGLLVEGALFTTANRLLELEKSVYRGDNYRFLIDAKR